MRFLRSTVGWEMGAFAVTVLLLSFSVVHAQSPSRIETVCTTTQLSAILDAVGGGHFEITTIIPFGMCPGHFDLSPQEARKLIEAPLVFCHGYERFLDDIQFGATDSIVRIELPENWMISSGRI